MTSYLKKAREWATPTLKTSAFLERGVLTPEEFVLAGDELVYKCPTWSWSSGDAKKRKDYLPEHKQFLITKGVPCFMRCENMEQDLTCTAADAELDNEGEDDEWFVATTGNAAAKKKEEPPSTSTRLEDEFDILDVNGEVVESTEEINKEITEDKEEDAAADDDEYADMADYEDDNILEDDDDAVISQNVVTDENAVDDNNILQTRTYDLSITYDKYYQTPRVWMFGYKENSSDEPLSTDEMFQDVMSDYVKRTVTIESHPHISGPHMSIHPCQHAKVMKNIVHNLIKHSDSETTDEDTNSESPSVEMYLFIFLKFVSSIIPTINYDFTMQVTANVTK